MSLFRRQAVEAQGKRLQGEVWLSQPLSLHVLAATLVCLVLLVGIFIAMSDYARKETVKGYLKPDKGMVNVFADGAGSVWRLHVKEGEIIRKGQPLVTISKVRSLASGGELEHSLTEEISQRLVLIRRERDKRNKVMELEENKLHEESKSLELYLNTLQSQRKTLLQRLSLKTKLFARTESLYKEQFISHVEYQSQKEQLLLVRHAVEQAESDIANVRMKQNQTELKLADLPERSQLEQVELDRRRVSLLRQQKEVENRFRYVIRATTSGVVTAIRISNGEFLKSGVALLSILPEGAVLVAELLLPSRSVGFVKNGALTRLRFDAFPYQRFGSVESTVSQVDKAILTSHDVRLPINLGESFYRVRAVLPKQSIDAYGQAIPLRSGMLLEADIILERRSLMQWLLDPIYSLKGRIG
ncbi:HlyD family efflux transporter periplasmic adaptor subunit [Ferrimonas sp. YFM]|uniref:HlyD family efflux transporter periplasmic adaptor subunit n=1 Tax=Ferrimonas sp. YFM TaxID=3028878 RepID=UPI00257271AE|nr:HlyD family efflux transporter periplasmic adaptor subunit [Ferrimonas sp. YFM]BDY06764.1 toxin secretion, membrane fusion protein [Ferrimonas sp. YFM]